MFYRKGRVSALCVVLLALSSLPSDLFALMIGLSTERLTEASDTVVVGRVESTESFWSADGSTIFTSALVIVDETVKGTIPTNPISVEYEGGELGNIALRVSDTSPLKSGEKVFLFLKSQKSGKLPAGALGADSGGVFRIVGRAQGKYTIGSDGIARKKGFSLASGQTVIDNDIPVSSLIEKIRNGVQK